MIPNKIALVIGQGGYNDMGLIRSCGEAGMGVVLISPQDMVIPIQKSRYVIKWIPCRISNSRELCGIIEKVREEYSSTSLFIYPASDLCACLIDESYNNLSQLATIPHANGSLRKLMDKAEMVRIAAESGLNVPASLRIDLRSNPSPKFDLPCIIKPLRSISGEKGDITICRSRDEYQSTLIRYQDKGFFEILLQTLVEGENQEEVAITGVRTTTGRVVAYGIIHKIRVRGNGSTVFAKYRQDVDESLQTSVKKFVELTGYIGIFDIEFLHNKNGYYFIECNFRNGAYGYAVTSAGFNMPAIFAGDIPREFKLCDITFMEERSDILNVFDHTISLRRWVCDLIETDTFLWSNRRDMRPLLRVPSLIKKMFRRIR